MSQSTQQIHILSQDVIPGIWIDPMLVSGASNLVWKVDLDSSNEVKIIFTNGDVLTVPYGAYLRAHKLVTD
jgi:hypothetical protein